MEVHVWFSRIWPARMPLVQMLRENPDGAGVRVFGTHPDPAAPGLGACDVTGVEPCADDAGFLGFALDFCRRHRIDVVVPGERLTAFADHADAFAGAGTRVMCPSPAAARTLTGKSRTYTEAAAAGLPLAPWRSVADPVALAEAVRALGGPGRTLCVKPAGEYSSPGFRILDDSPPDLDALLARPRPTVTTAALATALERAAAAGRSLPEYIVMPYLDPPEISVDCLADTGGTLLSAVPRAKEGRLRTLVDSPIAVAVAGRATACFRLPYLSNVQLRHHDGRPVLLEINPRPSAGLPQTAFAGLNLPWAAVRLLLTGDPGPLPAPVAGARLAVVEQAVPLPPEHGPQEPHG